MLKTSTFCVTVAHLNCYVNFEVITDEIGGNVPGVPHSLMGVTRIPGERR